MPMGEDPRHGILAALVVLLLGMLLLILAAFAVAPVLVIVLGLMTYVVWWHVSKEGTSYLHHAQEHENRFWTTVAFCFSGALVFVHDSPVALGQWSPTLGFVCVTLFTYTVHSLDRQFHRSRIGRAPNFRSLVENITILEGSAQDKCRRISVCLGKLDNRLVATNVNHMLWADSVQNLEKEIVTILSDADPGELNYMLPKVGLGLLFYKIKDHSPTKLHRTSLLDLLAVTRISDLNITSRAHVLDALQQMKLSAHRKSELYARNVILKTKGDHLSELKSLTDAKGDFHSIHKLVYQDIKDIAVREEVLKHIATQARIQAAHMQLGTRTGSRRSGKAWRKILSDVDDTLTCSGGRYPAGVDKRYPRKSIYPGVLDFYRELDLGGNGPAEWPIGQLGNLVFLSARPHLYKDMSESHSYAKFRRLQNEKGLYTSPTLLAGDIDTGTTMMFTGNVEPVAEKKFQNFAEYASIYPEFKHVFLGDNGQGDVKAAEMMAERFPHLLEAIYMHRVVPEEKTYGYQGAKTRKRWKQANIVFVGDYVEAACHAYKHGLIQAVGLQRVCQGAVQQFVDMKFETPLHRELQRRQINQSVWQANKLLHEVGLEPNWLIRAVRAFDDMEAVLTPFGRGTVVGFRPGDGVYEVLLHWPERGADQAAATAAAAAAAAASAASAAAAAAEAASIASASPSSATVLATPRHRRSQSSSPHFLMPKPRLTQTSRRTSFTNTLATRGRAAPAAAVSKSTRTAGSSLPPSIMPPVVGRSATWTTPSPETARMISRSGGGGGGETVSAAAGAGVPVPIVVPQWGPDAAGGGEAARALPSVAVPARPLTASGGGSNGASPERAAATEAAVSVSMSVSVSVGAGGAEEAAGGPTMTREAGRMHHGEEGNGGGAEGRGYERDVDSPRDVARPTTQTSLTEIVGGVAKRKSLLKSDSVAREGDTTDLTHPRSATAEIGCGGNDEPTSRTGARVETGACSWPPVGNDDRHLVPWVDGSCPQLFTNTGGSGSRSPGVREESSPSSPSVGCAVAVAKAVAAAAAAKAFVASRSGTMLVRAYLQLPGLKKAPPEAKRVYYKDDSDEPRSTRKSNRLSIFRSGQDAGGTAVTRFLTKDAIKSFTKGSAVRTSMGPATVNRVRTEDGMCEVSFDRWILSGGKPAFGVFRAADLIADTPAAAPPTVGKSPSLLGRTGMAISSLFKLSADPATSTPAHPEPRVGDVVDTIFGPAAVTRVRGPPALVSPGAKATATVTATVTATARIIDGRLGADWSRRKSDGGKQNDAHKASHQQTTFSSSSTTTATIATSATDRRETLAISKDDVAPGAILGESGLSSREGATPSTPDPGRTAEWPASGHTVPSPKTPQTPHRPPLPTSTPPRYSQEPSPSKPLTPSPTTQRPRANSATAAEIDSPVAFSGIADAGRVQLSSRGAGVLLPGKLFSPTSSTVDGKAAMGLPFSLGIDDGGDSDENGAVDRGESPLGVKILEGRGGRRRKGGGASPTGEVMYEVKFMRWRLGNNTPARAVLNRSSIWAEWETRPRRPTGTGVVKGVRRRAIRVHKKQHSSRPQTTSSFFGFISMVGLGGGSNVVEGGGSGVGGVMDLSPSGSPINRSKTQKAASAAAAAAAAKPIRTTPIVKLHPCEFPCGSCLKTERLGPSLVMKFRPWDGIYQVSLLDWKLKNGELAMAYLHRTAIRGAIAVPGAAVRTIMGLGVVRMVRKDGVIVVVSGGFDSRRSSGRGSGASSSVPTRRGYGEMTMYLQPSAIFSAARATVGERVDTTLGSGVVRCYSSTFDTYTVDLGWGLLYSPRGNAIRERRAAATSNTLSSRSSTGIINLFRWPIFGGASYTL